MKRKNKRLCNDMILVMMKFAHVQTLVTMCSVSKYCNSLVFKNLMQKQWNQYELERLVKHKVNILARHLLKNEKWIQVNFNHLFEFSCCCGNLSMVKYLHSNKRIDFLFPSNKKIECDIKNHYNQRCTHVINRVFVCLGHHGHLNVIKYLLKNKDLVILQQFASLALTTACKNGKHEIVEFLLQQDYIDPCDTGNLALKISSASNHIKVVELLLKDGRADPSDDDNNIIQVASEKGLVEIVRLLLKDKRVDPSVNDNFSIQIASKNGFVEIVRELLQDERVDIGARNNNAIKLASSNGFIEIVRLLLSYPKIRIDDNVQSAIYHAIKNNHFDIALLILKDSRIDKIPMEIAKIACKQGNINVFNTILDSPKFHFKFENPIYIELACENGHQEIVKLLLKNPNVKITDDCIHLVCKKKYHKILELLLKNERMLDNRTLDNCLVILEKMLKNKTLNPDSNENWLIQWACERGLDKLVRLLLQFKTVDPSVKNNICIQISSENGYTRVVKALLESKRVDCHANNNYALVMAIKNQHWNVVKLLNSTKMLVRK